VMNIARNRGILDVSEEYRRLRTASRGIRV
jgi:hypothetical protein